MADPRAVVLFRVRRVDDDVVLLEHEVYDAEQAHVQSVAAYDQALAAAAEGCTVVLEVMDPAGDIGPAGQWVVVVELRP